METEGRERGEEGGEEKRGKVRLKEHTSHKEREERIEEYEI